MVWEFIVMDNCRVYLGLGGHLKMVSRLCLDKYSVLGAGRVTERSGHSWRISGISGYLPDADRHKTFVGPFLREALEEKGHQVGLMYWA